LFQELDAGLMKNELIIIDNDRWLFCYVENLYLGCMIESNGERYGPNKETLNYHGAWSFLCLYSFWATKIMAVGAL
jgi:hypothetical protein